MRGNFRKYLSEVGLGLALGASTAFIPYTIVSVCHGVILYEELEKGVTLDQLNEKFEELPQPTRFIAQSLYPARMVASGIYNLRTKIRD